MSTLGGLLLPQFQPFDLGRSMNQGILGGSQLVQGQTALLALQEERRKQEAEAQVMQAIRTNPALAQQLLGGSTLGSLQSPPGMPPGGPSALTQQAFGPGGVTGPAQTIPSPPDASRDAGVSPQGGGPIPPDVAAQVTPTVTPPGGPQSTLASLGPQPQAPQNPLLELARRDPRAALLLQQRMQAQQTQQFAFEEKRLDIGVKVSEAVARQLQGVTDQASLDEARERIRLIHPQAAAQIPQFYSKEAVEALQQRGIAVADRAKTLLDEAKARRLDIETKYFPQMLEDTNASLPSQAPAGTPTTGVPPTGGAGNLPQRMNNPYNIKYGTGTRHWVDEGLAELGEKGQDGGQFLKFKDPQVGERAGRELLQGPGYRELTVDQALKKWSSNGYGAEIVKDIPATTLVKDLSDAQMRPLLAAMRDREGWTAGPSGRTQASTPNPQIAQLDAQIALRTRQAKQASLFGNESLSTRLNDEVNRLTEEKKRLEERATEAPRAAARVTAEEEARYQQKQQQQAQPMLPDERRKFLTGLRSDIRAEPTFKTYQEVRNGYQNVRVGAESHSAQGDLAIVNGLAKILDPTTGVREGEFQTIEAAQGRLQVLLNTSQKFFEGDRLTPENRQRFLALAHSLAQEKLTTAQKELQAVYEPLAKEGNIQFGQLLPLDELKPLTTAPASPGTNVEKFKAIKP